MWVRPYSGFATLCLAAWLTESKSFATLVHFHLCCFLDHCSTWSKAQNTAPKAKKRSSPSVSVPLEIEVEL